MAAGRRSRVGAKRTLSISIGDIVELSLVMPLTADEPPLPLRSVGCLSPHAGKGKTIAVAVRALRA